MSGNLSEIQALDFILPSCFDGDFSLIITVAMFKIRASFCCIGEVKLLNLIFWLRFLELCQLPRGLDLVGFHANQDDSKTSLQPKRQDHPAVVFNTHRLDSVTATGAY